MNRHQAVEIYYAVVQTNPGSEASEVAGEIFARAVMPLRYQDAIDALVVLARRSVFVSAAEITAEVKRTRERRIAPWLDKLNPPAGLTQTEEREWMRGALRRIGDGEPPPPGRVEGNHRLELGVK